MHSGGFKRATQKMGGKGLSLCRRPSLGCLEVTAMF